MQLFDMNLKNKLIADLLDKGLKSKMIAEIFNIPVKTVYNVKSNQKRVLRKQNNELVEGYNYLKTTNPENELTLTLYKKEDQEVYYQDAAFSLKLLLQKAALAYSVADQINNTDEAVLFLHDHYDVGIKLDQAKDLIQTFKKKETRQEKEKKRIQKELDSLEKPL